MILRQLIDYESHTYTYLLGDETSKSACLIDPVKRQSDSYLTLLRELDLSLVYALDTHVHADHITALSDLREATGCITIVGSENDVPCASEALFDNKEIRLGSLTLNAIYTPGHTSDSYCFLLNDPDATTPILFTGDTLLIRGTGRTDFQNGSAEQLYDSLWNKVLALPDQTIVLPGHDYKGWTRSTIGEEKRSNPRLAMQSKEAFIELMHNLKLPDPKLMDIAVPANFSCGKRKEFP